MARTSADSEAIGVLRELEGIKRLLILALLRAGTSQGDIAKWRFRKLCPEFSGNVVRSGMRLNGLGVKRPV